MQNKYNKNLGNTGEFIARMFLRLKLYKILQKNYKKINGEIDIIAKKGKKIIFVEVKTRTNKNFGEAILAVTPQKQRYIKRTAQYFLMNKKFDEIRFDIIEIYGKYLFGIFIINKINHIKGAF